MFSTYRRVFLLALVMAVFYYIPFFVKGWSTDVWIRFVRIQEWALAGFPWKETLMMGQNYPFGHEMHWTRPLDWIGYAFAWPFIPNWGLHRALEIMSFYAPLVVFLIGLGGFFYALKGYLTPKAAFLAFWLFFWGIGQSWGQASVGYYDHHVFHFTLLVWTIALTARFFLKPHALSLMIGAGVLTALGTWITAEFFINLYIVSLPFLVYWLFLNRSLKPLAYYTAAYTLTLLAAMSFDHPMAGFWTLDFYRVSLFHVLLGIFNLTAVLALMGFFALVKTSFVRRLIYGVLTGLTLICVLCVAFSDVFIKPLVDPFIHHFWIVYVQEMQPSYNSVSVVPWVILPILLALGFMIYVPFHLKRKETPLICLLIPGVLFYAVIMAFHVRVGISVNAFFVFLSTLFFNCVFFPREKGFKYTLLFVMFYMLLMGSLIRGEHILARIKQGVFDYYYNQYAQNQSIVLPEEMKKDVMAQFNRDQELKEKIVYGNQKPSKKKKSSTKTEEKRLSEKNPPSCTISDEALDVLKQSAVQGAVMMELFRSPEVLWKTGKPVFGGPYHGIIDGHKDLFFSFLDRSDFKRARSVVQKRKVSHIYLQHPGCYGYMFKEPDLNEPYPNLETTFYYTLYDESKAMPDWVQLEFYNENTGEKIFKVVEPKKKTKRKK